MSQITGAGFASGAIGAGVNEAIIGEIKKIKDPGTAQIVSAIVGAAAAKATGWNAGAGATAASSGTKWNYLAEGHNPVQIGISIKLGLLGHVGIIVKTDTGSYDSADYGRYGDDVEKSSSRYESPVGHGTFITRWFYDPKDRYTYMLNSQYVDAIQTVEAYNSWIKNNGYTQIPSEQTDLYFNEVRLSSDKDSKQIELAKQINENSQYYRNGTLDDYHLPLNNCATTTMYPIYFGISFKDISPEAIFTLYKLLGKFKPSEIQSILDDDFTYFHGKGLVAWKGYQEVPR